MNIDQFNNLVETHGSDVVYNMDDEYCFSIGDEKDAELYAMMGKLEEFEEECGKVSGIHWYVGYGDDLVNCVSVKDLNDFDKVVGLEEFVLEFVGSNCYTREEEFEDE